MVFIGPITTMKRTHFLHQSLPLIKGVLIKRNRPLVSLRSGGSLKSGAHFEHDLALSSFTDKIRKKYFTKMGQSFTASSPNKCLFPAIRCMLSRSSLTFKSSKSVDKPVYKRFISICNLHISLIILCSYLWITAEISNINRSFSVDNSGEICKVSFLVGFALVAFLWHVTAPVKGSGTIQNELQKSNIKLQPQRLSEVDTIRV